MFKNRSKTIQFGERLLIIPIVAIPGSSLCPVKAYLNMVKLVPAVNDAPAYSIFKIFFIINNIFFYLTVFPKHKKKGM
jgi:hypothetical protein